MPREWLRDYRGQANLSQKDVAENVVTRVAYRIWQLDIEDMERRLKKLRELKLGSAAS